MELYGLFYVMAGIISLLTLELMRIEYNRGQRRE